MYVTVTYLLVTVCQCPSVYFVPYGLPCVFSGGSPLYLCMHPSKLGLLLYLLIWDL